MSVRKRKPDPTAEDVAKESAARAQRRRSIFDLGAVLKEAFAAILLRRTSKSKPSSLGPVRAERRSKRRRSGRDSSGGWTLRPQPNERAERANANRRWRRSP